MNADRFARSDFDTPVVSPGNSGITLVSKAGTLTSIYCFHGVATATDNITYTLQINGVDTALTATILATQQSANLTGQAVVVAAGDRLTMKIRQNGTESVGALASRQSVSG